jgi:hypothetical protein
MDTPNRSFPSGDLRVSDADRDRAVTELSEHFQTGRLTQEEFEDRSGRALRARTGRELSELFTDLPQGTPPAVAGAPPAASSPGSVRRVPVAGVVIACVIAASIVGNVLSNVFGYSHSHTVSFGWLVPVLILGFIFRRTIGRR